MTVVNELDNPKLMVFLLLQKKKKTINVIFSNLFTQTIN